MRKMNEIKTKQIDKKMNKLTSKLMIILSCVIIRQVCGGCNTDQPCYEGDCIDGICDCYEGWAGELCNGCSGRILLNSTSGILTDGPLNYTINKNCSWLIQPASTTKNVTGATVRLHVNLFSTECGWDYLYIFDGDSIYSPLLATFNGYVYKKGDEDSREFAPELIAKSGQVYITFYSDRAVTSYGFNITYTIRECISDCAGKGICIDGECNCYGGYHGDWCEEEICPNHCSSALGHGSCVDDVCKCVDDYRGQDCSINSAKGYWSWQPFTYGARASYASVVVNNEMWLYGGLQFDQQPTNHHPSVFNPTSNKWRHASVNTTITHPERRYGHSMVTWLDSLLIFGGKSVTRERQTCDLWMYNMTSSRWNELTSAKHTSDGMMSSPLCLVGHSAEMVRFGNGTEMMIVMFGDHPQLALNQAIFEYDPVTDKWFHPITNGYLIHGSYGQSTVYDMTSQSIYMYGGYTHLTSRSNEFQLTNRLLAYDVITRTFRLVHNGADDVTGAKPIKRYLHSLSLVDDVMYVYGGDGHNSSDERKCFMTSLQAYSLACNKWKNLESFNYQGHAARYGHHSVVLRHNDSSDVIYMISGYDGEMINDVIRYHPGRCAMMMTSARCEDSWDEFGLSCSWNGSECEASRTTNCATGSDDMTTCDVIDQCDVCVATSGCVYCDDGKCKETCDSGKVMKCIETDFCSRFYDCHQCLVNRDRCAWKVVGNSYACTSYSSNMTSAASNWTCASPPCSIHGNCDECSANTRCMWCMSNQRCFTSTTYLFQYPYGQCLQWHSKENRQPSTTCPIHQCSSFLDTTHCYTHPGCGWCDSGDGTGIGTCMDGAASGPLDNTTHVEDKSLCAANRWYFVGSPECPCNGHSSCVKGAGVCEPCADNTTGERCHVCMDGYYGEARNGGRCKPCVCEDTADTCDPQSGACRCRTKGIVGDKCDQCKTGDTNYVGNASLPNGTCYYPIQQGYQYTFRIGNDVERYVTQLNFIHAADSQEDLSLKIEIDVMGEDVPSYANIKLAVGEGDLPYDDEVAIFYNHSYIDYQFAARLLDFNSSGVAAKTFRIYMYALKTPVYVKVSLIQRQHLLLTILLVLFSSFLILLILAAVGWRVKIWYDLRQVRQNRAVEMREMAARPFAQVQLDCGDETRKIEEINKSSINDVIKLPQVVSIEKTVPDSSLHLVSVFLWLPSTNTTPSSGSSMTSSSTNSRDNLYDDVNTFSSVAPPNGQCGLALGTALTTCKQRHQVAKSTASSINKSATRRRKDDRDSRQDYDGQQRASVTSSVNSGATTIAADDDDVTSGTNCSFYDNHAMADHARV